MMSTKSGAKVTKSAGVSGRLGKMYLMMPAKSIVRESPI